MWNSAEPLDELARESADETPPLAELRAADAPRDAPGPALDVLQWKHRLPVLLYWRRAEMLSVVARVDPERRAALVFQRMGNHHDIAFAPPARKALAAMALDGMPFGFCWQDVDDAERAGLGDLARRLRDLLPPR